MTSVADLITTIKMILPDNVSGTPETGQNDLVSDKDIQIREFIESQYYHYRSDVITITILYTFIFLVGLIGNFAIIWWHLDSRSSYYQRTASNMLVINLCLSDLMVIFFCCPFVAYVRNTNLWKFGQLLCTLIHYLQGTAVTSTTLSLTALAMSRYLMMQRNDLMAKKKAATLNHVLLIIVWFLSLIMPTPILFVRQLKQYNMYDYSLEFCLEVWDENHRKLFAIITFLIVYLAPCCALIYCHSKVSLALHVSARHHHNHGNLRGSAHKKAFRVRSSTGMSSDSNTVDNLEVLNDPESGIRKRLTLSRRHLSRLLVGITACFVFCWLPYNVTSFYLDYTESDIALAILPFTLLLGHAHSAINPIVYWILIRGERQKRMKAIELRSIMVQLSHNSMNERNKSKDKSENRETGRSSGIDTSISHGCVYYRYCARY